MIEDPGSLGEGSLRVGKRRFLHPVLIRHVIDIEIIKSLGIVKVFRFIEPLVKQGGDKAGRHIGAGIEIRLVLFMVGPWEAYALVAPGRAGPYVIVIDIPGRGRIFLHTGKLGHSQESKTYPGHVVRPVVEESAILPLALPGVVVIVCVILVPLLETGEIFSRKGGVLILYPGVRIKKDIEGMGLLPVNVSTAVLNVPRRRPEGAGRHIEIVRHKNICTGVGQCRPTLGRRDNRLIVIASGRLVPSIPFLYAAVSAGSQSEGEYSQNCKKSMHSVMKLS